MRSRTPLKIICLAASPALLAVMGCDRLGDNEAYTPRCVETRTAVALDEATTLGFTSGDVLALIEGTHEQTLTWSDGTTTQVSVGVSYGDGALNFVHSEQEVPPEDAGAYLDIGVICEDSIEVSTQLNFATEDGAFDEQWTATFVAFSADLASFRRDLDLDSLSGTYTYRAFDPADYDWVHASVEINMNEAGTSGVVGETAQLTSADTVSGTFQQVGVWGGVDPEQ